MIDQLKLPEIVDDAQLANSVKLTNSPLLEAGFQGWMERLRRTRRQRSFLKAEVVSELRSIIAHQKRGQKDSGTGARAMTIYGAKNREFELVIVLWGFGVHGEPEHQRRLLYNAITRAKERCLILLPSGKLLKTAPFM